MMEANARYAHINAHGVEHERQMGCRSYGCTRKDEPVNTEMDKARRRAQSDLDVARVQLRMAQSAIKRGTDLISETQTAIVRQRRNETDLKKKIEGLVELLNAFDKVTGVLDNSSARVTLPVEAADADKVVLRTFTIASRSRYGKTYDLTVELFKGDLGIRTLVLNCTCEAFRYTRGEVRNGTKEACKHILGFRREHPEWGEEARLYCRREGIAAGESITIKFPR